MNKNELKDVLKQHGLWLRSFGSEGRQADLRGADLRRADLQDADLRGAHFDDRQIIQFAYHVTRAGLSSENTSEDIKAELKRLIPLANKFHRVSECGFIEEA